MYRSLLLFIFFAWSSYLFAISPDNTTKAYWIGSLLSGSGQTIPQGHVCIQPYLLINNEYGFYGKNWHLNNTANTQRINPLISYTAGLTERFDFEVLLQAFYNHSQGSGHAGWGDSLIGIGYQIVEERENSWQPAMRLVLREIVPTGDYQNLESAFLETDLTGAGNYATSIRLNSQKNFVLPNGHALRLRNTIDYAITSGVSVSGFNAFGGGIGTKGKVSGGDTFIAILACEYAITKHWVFANDLAYVHINRFSFEGFPGYLKNGHLATVGRPSSENLSLAPALEFNYNKNAGIIFGVWFSVAGRNSSAFFSPVLSVDVYF